MTPTKDQQAQEYAEKIYSEIHNNPYQWPHFGIIKQAYSDGYTAGEQTQWRSVKNETPDIYTPVLVHDTDSTTSYVAYLDHRGDWHSDETLQDVTPTHWMPIPSLPDTNN